MICLLYSGFGGLVNLVTLAMKGCASLAQLPDDFGQLQKLSHLFLDGCSALQVRFISHISGSLYGWSGNNALVALLAVFCCDTHNLSCQYLAFTVCFVFFREGTVRLFSCISISRAT